MNRFGIQAGDSFGNYRVIEEAGRGGMATVLRVEDQRDGAIRALKILMPSSQDQEARSRFEAEFMVLSKLSHPNITRVFESGNQEGHAYFVMELVEGHDLRAELESWKGLHPTERFKKIEAILDLLSVSTHILHRRFGATLICLHIDLSNR